MAYSSQECSACHYVDAKNRLSQSEFQCIKCGYTEHADINASKVIKHRGLVVLNSFDATTYEPKSKKTVGFRKQNNNKINSKSKKFTVGQGLPEFKPDENLSDIVRSNDLSVLDSWTQETPTTSLWL